MEFELNETTPLGPTVDGDTNGDTARFDTVAVHLLAWPTVTEATHVRLLVTGIGKKQV